MIRRFFTLSLFITITSGNWLFAQSTMPAVFVTNNVGDSITSFSVNEDGSLNFVTVTPSGEGPQSIALSPNGKYLAVGHGTISDTVEQLRIFEVMDDATLVEVENMLIPNSPLDATWLSNEILAVTETTFTINNLITYRFDPIDASLTVVDIEFTGEFSYNIAVARNSSLVYANNTFGDASIVAMSADDQGNLSTIETQIVEPLFVVAVATSPDGNFLYGAGGISGSGNEIIGFEIDATGLLKPIPGVQSPGTSPKVIDMTADGTILLAGHGTDSTVQSFMRDTNSGELIPTGFSFDVGSQGNLGDLVVMGDIMFVTDESTFDNGVRGLQSLQINADGSFTPLSPVVDTQGSRPEYIATWPGISDCLPGDINLDGTVDLLDVAPFVALLSSGGFQKEADVNDDGSVSLLDVALFVDLLPGS